MIRIQPRFSVCDEEDPYSWPQKPPRITMTYIAVAVNLRGRGETEVLPWL